MEILGFGEDGEKVSLEKVHPACWLVHCENNGKSPFEFEMEKDARAFAQMLGVFRLESRLKAVLEDY